MFVRRRYKHNNQISQIKAQRAICCVLGLKWAFFVAFCLIGGHICLFCGLLERKAYM